MSNEPKIAYFGGEPLAVPVIEALKAANILPQLIICNPDRPSGRGHKLTPPPAKVWAEAHSIPVFQPTSCKRREDLDELLNCDWDLFLVVAYNHILPEWLINIPKHGTLNVHPSLLPKLRGPSPIRSAILLNQPEAVGVTVMQMDAEMDHGPIVAQTAIEIPESEWPINGEALDDLLAAAGGELLAVTIPEWLEEAVTPTEQNHAAATYTKKLSKADAELALDPYHLPQGNEAYHTLCKIKAFAGWPETFFIHEGTRYKIKDAELAANGSLHILRVVPEGKKETDFTSLFPNR